MLRTHQEQSWEETWAARPLHQLVVTQPEVQFPFAVSSRDIHSILPSPKKLLYNKGNMLSQETSREKQAETRGPAVEVPCRLAMPVGEKPGIPRPDISFLIKPSSLPHHFLNSAARPILPKLTAVPRIRQPPPPTCPLKFSNP